MPAVLQISTISKPFNNLPLVAVCMRQKDTRLKWWFAERQCLAIADFASCRIPSFKVYLPPHTPKFQLWSQWTNQLRFNSTQNYLNYSQLYLFTLCNIAGGAWGDDILLISTQISSILIQLELIVPLFKCTSTFSQMMGVVVRIPIPISIGNFELGVGSIDFDPIGRNCGSHVLLNYTPLFPKLLEVSSRRLKKVQAAKISGYNRIDRQYERIN